MLLVLYGAISIALAPVMFLYSFWCLFSAWMLLVYRRGYLSSALATGFTGVCMVIAGLTRAGMIYQRETYRTGANDWVLVVAAVILGVVNLLLASDLRRLRNIGNTPASANNGDRVGRPAT